MEIFHVTNRGVDGRAIFKDIQDYRRFVHDLFEFNDTAAAPEFLGPLDTSTSGRTTSRRRNRLVDIHGWTLMENHYHLLLSERVEGGLTRFLRKLSGYARYFNDRHMRQGALLQGRSRKVIVERQSHFLYVLHYIHLNPLDYFPGAESWRERDRGIMPDADAISVYLRAYPWSSYRDYCGMANVPAILTTDLFNQAFEGGYEAALASYIQDGADDAFDRLATNLEC